VLTGAKEELESRTGIASSRLSSDLSAKALAAAEAFVRRRIAFPIHLSMNPQIHLPYAFDFQRPPTKSSQIKVNKNE
jgi:hypothetical protein